MKNNKNILSLSTLQFISLFTLVNMIFYHLPLYSYCIDNLDIYSSNGILTFISVLIAIYIISYFLFFIIAFISLRLLHFFSIVVLIANSIAVYFIITYQVILDTSMIGNAFNTDFTEASSYYHPKIFIYLLFLGIIPAFFISKIKLIPSKRIKLTLVSFAVLFIGIFLLYLNATTWLWLDKHAKILGGMTMPWSYSINAIRYKTQQLNKNKKQILLPTAKLKDNNKMLVVLVIGESARASNFSLYGYNKPTNPLLKNLNNLSILNAKATATYTTASVHSMISYLGNESDDYEPLPNYLQRSGINVIWRKNNWGAGKLKVNTLQSASELRSKCKGEGCLYDEVLLTNLLQEISISKTNKTFVVLHTAGSHGPTYYKKYPKTFEVFKPVCKTVDLKECTSQELINAYDNTILYTDYFLHKTITTLKKINDRPVVMLYISDHGESLGEYGLYLHGTPYSIAPDFQKNIPFLIWQSNKFIKENGNINKSFNSKKEYGQDNIFHTIIGAFGLNSTIYNKKLDLLN